MSNFELIIIGFINKIDHKKISSLLLDQANILDGNILSNPTNYIKNLTDLFIINY